MNSATHTDSAGKAEVRRVSHEELDVFRQLYHCLTEYRADSLYQSVLLPSLATALPAMALLERFRRMATAGTGGTPDDQDASWQLYALGRVNDFLLLPFQDDERNTWTGPRITFRQYLDFFLRLGMIPVTCEKFSPFFYEIVRLEQAEDPEEPVRVLEHFWPGLRFGEMMFSRSGVLVRGGSQHVVKEVAETSTLYFTYRRLHRRTEDPSMGWGSNSQWRTDYRRDYEVNGKRYYNSQGRHLLGGQDLSAEDRDNLTAVERLELCRNRSFIRSRTGDDTDLWPHHDSWEEPA